MTSEPSSVIDMLPGLVRTALDDGCIDYVNRAWCEYTGMDIGQARGEGWQACIHPDGLLTLPGNRQSIVTSGNVGNTKVRLQRFDIATRSNEKPGATFSFSLPCQREPARDPGVKADDAQVRATKDC